MKKRVILGTILPVFAAVAVIGSGYAIWHFNDTESKLNTSMSFGITNVIQGASLTKDFDKLTLTFDQTTTNRETVNASEASNLGVDSISNNGTTTAKGITLTATNSNTSVTDPTVSYKNVTTDGVDSYATPEAENPTIGQVFTVTLSMPTTVANYITITLNDTATNWSATTTKDSSTTDGTTTWVWTNTTYGEATWKWSYVTFSYDATTKEPTNISEYTALSSVISAANTASSATATYQAYRWAK